MILSAQTFRNAAVFLLSLCLCGLSGADVAWSQSNMFGCVLERVGASQTVLRCRDGLAITPEVGARYSLVDRDGDGSVDAVRLQRKALLVDAPEGRSGSGFQVITPQAIAAVRGTRWAVDTAAGKTSVFVVRGRVSVQRPSASAAVVLGPGEGVDVEPGTAPLTVRRWPPARAAALLARLGQ